MVCIGVSASLVVVTSGSGICYVWELYSKILHPLRISDSPIPTEKITIQALGVSQNTLVIRCDVTILDPLNVEITTWELKSKIPVHFYVSIPRPPSSAFLYVDTYTILLNPAGDTILCYNMNDPSRGSNLHFTRLSLTGEVLDKTNLGMPHPGGVYYTEATTSVPTDGPIVFWTWVSRLHVVPVKVGSNKPKVDLKITSVVYDTVSIEIPIKESWIHTEDEIGPGQYIDESGSFTTHDYSMFFWNDVAYYRAPRYIDGETQSIPKVIEFNRTACSDAEVDDVFVTFGTDSSNVIGGVERVDPRFKKSMAWGKSNFTGDDRYLINYNEDWYQVWCFDKTVTLIDEDLRYKKRMQDATPSGPNS